MAEPTSAVRHLQCVEGIEYIYAATEGDSSDENNVIEPVVSLLVLQWACLYDTYIALITLSRIAVIDYTRCFVFHWSSAPPLKTARAVQVIATPCVGGVLLRASVLGAQSAGIPASQ